MDAVARTDAQDGAGVNAAPCVACDLVARRDGGSAPLWDCIVRTSLWDVVHAFDTSLEGWIVLVLRRHAPVMADLTPDEAMELGPLLRSVFRALHEVTGCAKTYVAQFAEHPLHPHVHVHVVPKPWDLSSHERGPRIFSRLGVPPAERVPEERRNEIAASLRAELERAGTGLHAG